MTAVARLRDGTAKQAVIIINPDKGSDKGATLSPLYLASLEGYVLKRVAWRPYVLLLNKNKKRARPHYARLAPM